MKNHNNSIRIVIRSKMNSKLDGRICSLIETQVYKQVDEYIWDHTLVIMIKQLWTPISNQHEKELK